MGPSASAPVTPEVTTAFWDSLPVAVRRAYRAWTGDPSRWESNPAGGFWCRRTGLQTNREIGSPLVDFFRRTGGYNSAPIAA